MKIRLDYVSNSSSSSFMLIGHAFDDEEIKKAWLKLFPEQTKEEDEEDFDLWDIVEKLSEKLDLNFERGIENFYDMWAIGLSFSDMKDDETKRDFIKRISERLKPAFGDVKVEELVDGGRDD